MGYATHSVRLVAAATGTACSIVVAIAAAQAGAAPPTAPAAVSPTATDTSPGAAAVPPVTAAQADAGDRPLDFVLEARRKGVEPMDADEAAERAVKSAPSMAKARA